MSDRITKYDYWVARDNSLSFESGSVFVEEDEMMTGISLTPKVALELSEALVNWALFGSED